MTTAISFLLAATFVISVGGLALLIWALANDQFTLGERAARTIFAEGEVGSRSRTRRCPKRPAQTCNAPGTTTSS
jgi:nitrogen fixation-related uncharacterized protein